MIKVSNLSKVFRTEEIETTALNGVSFEIKDGEKDITSSYDSFDDNKVLILQ